MSAEYLREIEGVIRTHGHAIQAVSPTFRRTGYMYTIGMNEHGFPDVLIPGIWNERGADATNAAVDHMRSNPSTLGGNYLWSVTTKTGVFWCALIECPVDIEMFPMVFAAEYFGQTRGLAFVFQDNQGLWPWQWTEEKKALYSYDQIMSVCPNALHWIDQMETELRNSGQR